MRPKVDRYLIFGGEPVIESFRDALDATADEIVSLLLRKRHDYGTANILKFGETGIVVRVSDKFERLVNLLQTGQDPANESTEDTWRDVAGYAFLALALRRIGPELFRDLPAEPDDVSADYATFVDAGRPDRGQTRNGVDLVPPDPVPVTTGPLVGRKPVRGIDYPIPWIDGPRTLETALNIREYQRFAGTFSTIIAPETDGIRDKIVEWVKENPTRAVVIPMPMVRDLYKALLSYGLRIPSPTIGIPDGVPLWREDIEFAKAVGLLTDWPVRADTSVDIG